MSGIIEWEDLTFPDRVVLKSRSTKSFLNFTRVWFELSQGDRLLVNWHHRLMASKIDDLIAGRLEPGNLIINIPPGGTKTEFFSIHFPAYVNALVQGVGEHFCVAGLAGINDGLSHDILSFAGFSYYNRKSPRSRVRSG